MASEQARTVVDTSAMSPRHGRLKRRNGVTHVLRWVALGMAVVVASAVGIVGVSVLRLTQGIATVDLGVDAPPAQPGFAPYQGGFNILLVGSDQRTGQGAAFGESSYGEGRLNDVTMLLHVSEDQQSATVVSFPRDLMIDFPECEDPETGQVSPAASNVQFNQGLSRGGLSCVAASVSELTGLEVPFAAMITFNGVIAMSSAVGGVPVCFAGPVDDRWSGLQIPEAGTYDLEGEQALQFLRSRHGVGDGSDLARISSQQVFMSSLARTMQSDAVLTDITKLYAIAQVATENMTLSSGLGDIGTMVSMGRVLADIPLDTMQFVLYPNVPEGNRVAPDPVRAEALMELIRADRPIQLGADSLGVASTSETPGATETPGAPGATEEPAATETTDPVASGTAEPTPTESSALDGVVGQDAAQESCVVPFGS